MCCVYTNMYIFSQSQLHHSKIMPKFKKLQKRKVKLYQNGVVVHSSVIDLANVGNESASLPPTEFLDPPHASSTDLSSSMSEAPDPGHQPSSSVLLDISKCNSYCQKRHNQITSWIDVRSSLLGAGVESNSPATFHCCSCASEDQKIIFCIDCGPFAYFCEDCFIQTHKFTVLHIAKQWKDSMFIPFATNAVWRRSDGHHDACENTFQKQICVFDSLGRQHRIKITLCKCEPQPVTFLRYNVWASTPLDPKVAFHLELMEWFRILMLECQLSLQGFCNAVKYRFGTFSHFMNEISSLYKVLVSDTMAEYRFYIYKMQQLQSICPDYNNGKNCPACFQSRRGKEQPAMYAIDANFGLVRKKSSGQNFSSPKFDDLYFLKQSEVDHHINLCKDADNSVKKDCSNFKAGNALRSQSRKEKLDETAVMGSVCRHEYPVKFLNLKHGERLSYPVTLMKDLLSCQGNEKTVILYDIACVLDKHLKKNKHDDLLEKIVLAVPIFHGYGHNMLCQVKYSPRTIHRLGLIDGEATERLWSFLRRFARLTKEMTPENRTDTLSEALLHYARKLNSKLFASLPYKLEKAISLKANAEMKLKEIIPPIEEHTVVSVDLVKSWIEEERSKLEEQCMTSSSWQENYVLNLERRTTLQESLATAEEGDEIKMQNEIARLDILIRRQEKNNSVARSWTRDMECYQQSLLLSLKHKKIDMITLLKSKCAERQYLISMIKKYADGQAIAIRLNKQICKISNSIKVAVQQYNSLPVSPVSIGLPPQLSFQDVTDQKSVMWQPNDTSHAVSSSIKRDVIEQVNLLNRASEEIVFVKEDMANTLDFFIHEHSILCEKLKDFQTTNTAYSLGASAMIYREIFNLECKLNTMDNIFSKYIECPKTTCLFFNDEVPDQETTVDYEDSTDGDSDSDND